MAILKHEVWINPEGLTSVWGPTPSFIVLGTEPGTAPIANESTNFQANPTINKIAHSHGIYRLGL
jgi:hypothetical protein